MNNATQFLARQGCHILAVLVDYHVIDYGGRRWERSVRDDKEANEWMNDIESTLCRENVPTSARSSVA